MLCLRADGPVTPAIVDWVVATCDRLLAQYPSYYILGTCWTRAESRPSYVGAWWTWGGTGPQGHRLPRQSGGLGRKCAAL